MPKLTLPIHLTYSSLKRLKPLLVTQWTNFLPLLSVFQEIIEAQKNDKVCMQVRGYCQAGWPGYMPQQPLLRPYWENRAHLEVVDDLLPYDERIVIPQALRLDILDCIHCGHLGISKCRARAGMSVWWPGLSVTMKDMVKACFT